ncbi:Uncharacterized conserved protein [Halogranum amylolyticum]|uniref:Uncharacterized conserved protein n=1 Tax=Halogranum amylolyticum TaxID=660520 RepID=A0A1H8W4U9_9EURY|nr:hypothetical protein [Halogranum amylolyticum]SEP22675.1 Uncharacterized conserved protein [Halogranum amylolyticum]
MNSLPAVVVLSLVLATVFAAPVAAQVDTTQVIGEPDLRVVSPTYRFTPGQEVTLDLYVVNEGDVRKGGPAQYVERVTTARAATVRLRAGDAPVEVTSGRVPVGEVSTGTAGPFGVSLVVGESAPPGRYRLPVDVEYVYTRIVTVDEGSADPSPRYLDIEVTERQYVEFVVEDTARFTVVDVSTDVLVGDRGTFDLTLRNVGTEPARDLRVALTSTSDELQFGTETATAGGFVTRLEPGETASLRYTVSVAGDVVDRDYPVDVAVTYTDVDGIRREGLPLSASVRAGVEQAFSLGGVATTLSVGQEGTVTGTVYNDGPEPVSSPVVGLAVGSEYLDVPEPEFALPDLAPGESAGFAFDVDVSDAATAGFREFTFDVRYRTARGDVRTSDPLPARVEIAPKRPVFRVDPLSDPVPAGGSDTLVFRVTNDGRERVTDVTAKAFFDDPLDSDDDEAFVAALDPGESTNVTFRASVARGAASKVYPVSVDFEYDTPDGDTEISEAYRVPVAVTAAERRGVGLDAPASLVGVGLLVAVVAGVWIWRRR